MDKDSVHKPQPFWREGRAEAESNRGPSAYQPNALITAKPNRLIWHHKTFLVQLYWHLAIKLYYHCGYSLCDEEVVKKEGGSEKRGRPDCV